MSSTLREEMIELCGEAHAESWLSRGPRQKITQGFGGRKPGGLAGDNNLARLSAFEIRKEHEAARIYALKQNRAQQRTPIDPNCRKTHRRRLDDSEVAGLLHPCIELTEGVYIEVFAL